MKRNLSNYLTLFMKGIGMGAADVVPGVSGGTIAFITGIYDELIDTIKGFLPAFKSFGGNKSIKQRITDFWKATNANFLLALLSGILLAVAVFANAVKYMLDEYPILINAFFFGLIAASIILVYNKVKKWNGKCYAFGLLGVILAFCLPESVTIQGSETISLFYLFICGAIAICAMILPGISGSFILVLMGAYNAIITALKDLNFAYIFVFAAGAFIGILAFSNFLSWLLKKYHDFTVALLTGFILGSLNIIWPWKAPLNVWPNHFEMLNGTPAMLLEAVGACLIGVILVLGIEFVAKRLQKK